MSCPNWFFLVTRRDDEPELWERALEHHEDCDRCREEALDADPTLLFHRMLAPELDRQDIADIKLAVATMRRALPLAEVSEESVASPLRIDPGHGKSLRSPKIWLRAAALGALVLGAAWFEGSVFEGVTEKGEPELTLASLATPTSLVSELPLPALSDGESVFEGIQSELSQTNTLPGKDPSIEEPPLVEDADPSYGSIVEVVGQDISFVLVLPSLDV